MTIASFNSKVNVKSFDRYNDKCHDLCNYIEKTTFAEGTQQPSQVTVKTLEDGIRRYLQFEHGQKKNRKFPREKNNE